MSSGRTGHAADLAARSARAAGRRAFALDTRVMNALQRLAKTVAARPGRILSREALNRGDPPRMIAGPGAIAARVQQRAPGDLLTEIDRFEHRAARFPPAADVVALADSRILHDLPHRGDEIFAVDVVSHLLPAVTMDRVRRAGNGASHQMRQEAVQLDRGVPRAGDAAAAEHGRLHAELTPVLLHRQIRCRLADAVWRMQGLIDAHRLVDAVVVAVSARQLHPAIE